MLLNYVMSSLSQNRERVTSHLYVPVLVQVVDAGYASPVAVGIVHMPHVSCSVAGVTRHHGLVEKSGVLRNT